MIFYHFLSSLLYEEKYNQADTSNAKDPIALTIEMMQRKINSNLTLSYLASFANLSISHFSSLFRASTGFSPVEYFNHLKIQHSCQKLVFTQKFIKRLLMGLVLMTNIIFREYSPGSWPFLRLNIVRKTKD